MMAESGSQPSTFGPYRLQERINTGGMSEIWLATNTQGEVYALRKLHKTSLFDFITKQRFITGCEVLSKIHNHEFVIGYVEHGKINGELYLLMEYVEGANLKQLLASMDPLLQENVSTFLIEMAVALEHVHDSGFMHLDYKPENILVSRNGSLRLIDFDLAQPIPEKAKKLGKNPGTPAYMAPEQLLREPVDQRADIFAFGVAAYELVTTEKPFPGENADQILKRQLDRSDFKEPRQLNPDIPVALEKVILKCLEREPEKRYPYMSVLVLDLQKALYV